ncbi:hypothetical protein UlMin_018837 [Ulmus minor]
MNLFNTTARTIHPIQVGTLYPSYTNSLGLWNKSDVKHLNFSLFTMPVLELEMLFILILTQLSHLFSQASWLRYSFRTNHMVSGVLMPMFVTIGMIKANPFDLSLVSNVSKANAVLVFVIDSEVYTFVMAVVFMTTIVRVLYDPMRKYAGYLKRNIMHSAANSDSSAVPCRCSSPTNSKRTLSNYSYLENVILSFMHFQRENHGTAFVNVFTLTSLIILSFHRKWTSDGSIESKDPTIRSVNCSVMERSPCSVAIVVDRGHMESIESVASRQASYRVAMIFLGGSDDKEALMFSKRMVKDSCIKLSVIHFLKTHNWDKVLDHEILKKVSQGGNGDADFLNTQTATVLRSLFDDYDLFIVGWRFSLRTTHTSSLDVIEFPKLGVVGNLLASTDVFTRVYVLVVQQ